MKKATLAALIASSAFITACAGFHPDKEQTRRVSQDYTAIGANEGVSAYLYGNKTVIELSKESMHLSVRDETGAAVPLEKEGRYYRLDRALDSFTASINGHAVQFNAIPAATVFSAPASAIEPPKVAAVAVAVAPQNDKDMVALLKLTYQQLGEVKRGIDAASKNPKASGADLFKINAQIKEIEDRISGRSAATLRFSFPSYGTKFEAGAQAKAVLIASAKSAETVNLRGYTDSRVGGPLDAEIALGRALSAQKYLVSKGIPKEKINVSSQADGGFIAPYWSKSGRAINRRVEIEILDQRVAGYSKPGAVQTASKTN